jgi:formamidopyrimidine-DNA glycosylase
VPELSDVEGFRRYFARFAAGRRIEGVSVPDAELLRNASPRALGRALRDRRFGDPRRHGKWLLAPADGATVLMHFGMTGLLRWTGDAGSALHQHDRLVFRLEGGELRYRNMRRFGGVWLARDAAAVDDIVGDLGPDAMSVDRERFEELLAGRRGRLKPALMDQELIAGLGNLLVDEILWRARLHPRRPLAAISSRERDRLHREMHRVLRESIPRARVPPEPSWLTGVRDDPAGRCPRCGARLARAQVGGRTACLCPRCQPERRGRGRRR